MTHRAIEIANVMEVCHEILDIMAEYDKQLEEHGYVDSPGGFEHMGDVWYQFQVWQGMLVPQIKETI